MSVTVQREDHFDFLSPEYADLHAAAGAPVFQHGVWLDRLYRDLAPARGARPVVVTVRAAGGELLAVLPLAISGRVVRTVTAADLGVADYNVPVASRSVLDELRLDPTVSRDVRRALGRCDLLTIDRVPDSPDDVLALVDGARSRRHHYDTHVVALGPTPEEWRATLDPKFVRHLDRKYKRLRPKGERVLRKVTDVAEVVPLMERMRAFRAARFADRRAVDLVQDEATFAFYCAVAEASIRAGGPGRLMVLEVAGEPVAIALDLVAPDRELFVLVGYDVERLRNYSLGLLVVDQLAQDAIGRGTSSVRPHGGRRVLQGRLRRATPPAPPGPGLLHPAWARRPPGAGRQPRRPAGGQARSGHVAGPARRPACHVEGRRSGDPGPGTRPDVRVTSGRPGQGPTMGPRGATALRWRPPPTPCELAMSHRHRGVHPAAYVCAAGLTVALVTSPAPGVLVGLLDAVPGSRAAASGASSSSAWSFPATQRPARTSSRQVPPADALHVSRKGSDRASGSSRAPLRTIGAALGRADDGDTVVVHGGSYHESVEIEGATGVTLMAAPRARVWLDGSRRVSGWTPSAGTWVSAGWTPEFDASPTYSWGEADNTSEHWQFVDPAHPMAAHPDQVWIDEVRQEQVGRWRRSGPARSSSTSRPTCCTSAPTPRGARCGRVHWPRDSACGRRRPGSCGIGVRRYANSVPHMGAVTVEAPGTRLVDVAVVENATGGLHVMDRRSGCPGRRSPTTG